MYRILLPLAFAILVSAACLGADAPPVTPPSDSAPAAKPVVPPIDQPVPQMGKDGNIPAWYSTLHQSHLDRGKKGPIGVLFIGDSITELWDKAIWEKNFGDWAPANFGIRGDTVQNVLWRFDNGELDGLDPKVVVLLIGSNNIRDYTADQIIQGDEKIVSEIHTRLPKAKLLVLGVFPRGADPTSAYVKVMREKIIAINSALAKLDDGNQTRYLDIGPKFLSPDGTITKEIMADGLHPTPQGYEIFAAAILPQLSEMMK